MPVDRSAESPSSFEARRRAAEALAHAGRTDEAVERYLELLRDYAARGRLSRAVSVFQSLLALDGGRGATQVALATLFTVPRESGTTEVDELARAPMFAGLDRAAFLSVLSRLERRAITAGETIVREGEPGETMFVITQGTVNVVRQSPGGSPHVVDTMEEGDFFGEIALVSHAPRLATVVAETDGELLVLDRACFERISREHPSIGAAAERLYKARLLTNLLRASPLFGLLPEATRARLIEVFTVQTYPASAALLEMGKPGKGLFVLLRGQCGVFHPREDGSEASYPTMHEGDVFGELSLLNDGIATATVRTLVPCVLLELRREWFDELLLSHGQVRDRIYALGGERHQRTRDLIAGDALARRLV
jgi:cAMP-dependent protein kinase regulator